MHNIHGTLQHIAWNCVFVMMLSPWNNCPWPPVSWLNFQQLWEGFAQLWVFLKALRFVQTLRTIFNNISFPEVGPRRCWIIPSIIQNCSIKLSSSKTISVYPWSIGLSLDLNWSSHVNILTEIKLCILAIDQELCSIKDSLIILSLPRNETCHCWISHNHNVVAYNDSLDVYTTFWFYWLIFFMPCPKYNFLWNLLS